MMEARREQLVRHFLLVRRKRLIERAEGREQSTIVLRHGLREAAARLERLHGVFGLTAEVGPRRVDRLGVGAHCLGHLVPLWLLLRRDLEFGLEEGDAAGDEAFGAAAVPMPGLRLRAGRWRGDSITRRRRGGTSRRLREGRRGRDAAAEADQQGKGGDGKALDIHLILLSEREGSQGSRGLPAPPSLAAAVLAAM